IPNRYATPSATNARSPTSSLFFFSSREAPSSPYTRPRQATTCRPPPQNGAERLPKAASNVLAAVNASALTSRNGRSVIGGTSAGALYQCEPPYWADAGAATASATNSTRAG